jgi:hypothetical protein
MYTTLSTADAGQSPGFTVNKADQNETAEFGQSWNSCIVQGDWLEVRDEVQTRTAAGTIDMPVARNVQWTGLTRS